jgi:hypothetical protein
LAEVAAVSKRGRRFSSASPTRLNGAGDDGLVVNGVPRRQRQM